MGNLIVLNLGGQINLRIEGYNEGVRNIIMENPQMIILGRYATFDGRILQAINPQGGNPRIITLRSGNYFGGHIDLSYASILVDPTEITILGKVILYVEIDLSLFEGNLLPMRIPYVNTTYEEVLNSLSVLPNPTRVQL